MIVEIPDIVRRKAAALGVAAWLAELPDLLAAIGEEWGITFGRVYQDPTEAFVADVQRADGSPAVLKALIPSDPLAAEREIGVLRVVDGDGCPKLYRADVPRGVWLMERLGPSMSELGLPLGQRQAILCAAAARMWRPVADLHLPSGADKGRWLAQFIESEWEALARPCSQAAIGDALRCADRRIRAHDDERAVLVHGDVHQWNTLRSGDGWALVDPDGLLAEPAYDLGVMIREDPVESSSADPLDHARRLASWTGVDATAIWEWGVVERVSTGLLATRVDLQPAGRQMLEAADLLAAGLT